jgi:hypothetical protein
MKNHEAIRKIDGLEHRFSILQKEWVALKKELSPVPKKKTKTKTK